MPSLIVFDLDACCWSPEMFELWGGGAPFIQEGTQANNTLRDAKGTRVRMLGNTAQCWADLHWRMQAGEDLLVGVASRSDEPAWARECLKKFIVAPGVSMMDVVTEARCEIYKGSKRSHFAALQVCASHAQPSSVRSHTAERRRRPCPQRKTGVAYERMAFFDDDPHNVRDVAGLGVHCFLTPHGNTAALVAQGCAAAGAGGASDGGGWAAFDNPAQHKSGA